MGKTFKKSGWREGKHFQAKQKAIFNKKQGKNKNACRED